MHPEGVRGDLGRAAEIWPVPQGRRMDWRPGTAALPGLSAHDAFEIANNFGMRRVSRPKGWHRAAAWWHAGSMMSSPRWLWTSVLCLLAFSMDAAGPLLMKARSRARTGPGTNDWAVR
ncbi:MAG: hypothetical protein EBS42_16085, partial [Caulobacteraceae bacterium]|nr:hypothetical protein [Caulobacteraceae bacterium]